MSKPIPQEEYNKKPLTRFLQWISGDIDPFLENMETRQQQDYKPNEWLVRKHRRDQEAVIRLVHDQKHNRVYKGFRRFYKVASVVCCVALIAILLLAVSYLPPVGSAENPSSNEVAAKYIEDGLQDTGAVNIVTGMILDYRAFDTFGESTVLFVASCGVIFLIIAILMVYITTSTKYGKRLFAIGSNTKAAHMAGINVEWTRVSVFTIAGLLCGVGATLWICQQGGVDPATTGVNNEMFGIAATVLGGIAMSGGKGKLVGVIFGAMSYTLIDKIIAALNVDSLINNSIKGLILLIAIVIQILGPQIKNVVAAKKAK